MVKRTQTIRRQKPTNCLSVLEYFVGLKLKGLTIFAKKSIIDNRCLIGPSTRFDRGVNMLLIYLPIN